MDTMKLSEAIRAGAAIRPQVEGALFLFDEDTGACVGSCALGAALEGATGSIGGGMAAVVDHFPECYEEVVPPVNLKLMTHRVSSTVAMLNDSLGWSREQIADWLESLGY